MSWLYLTLISAVSLGLADAFTKRYFSESTGLSILLVRFSFPSLFLLPAFVFIDFSSISAELWFLMLLLIPMEVIAMWLYVVAIRDAPLHLTLPYLAFTPVFIILTGFIFLDEKVSVDGIIGILLIVSGAYLLNIDRVGYSWSKVLAPFTAIIKVRGSLYMLVVSAILSITAVLSKYAMQFLTPETFGVFYFSFIGIAAVILIVIIQPLAIKQVSKYPWPILLVSLLMAVMVITHFLAISKIEAAYMVAVKRTSLIFGMLAGAWMFRDMNFRQHLPAAIIMLSGVFIVSS